MELTALSRWSRRAHIRQRVPLLLLMAPLVLVLSACASGKAAGDTVDSQSSTSTKGGIQMTISPSSGPVGTAVNVTLSGVPANSGYGVVSFRDATGAFGEDELTTQYVVDTRAVGEGGSLRLAYTIPANVLVLASPGAQNPTEKTPTAAGSGALVLSVANVELEVPFTVGAP